MDFLEKLKQMIMGSTQPAPTPEPTGKPWEQPMDPGMTPGFNRMPGGPLMPDAAMHGQGGPPAAPQDDIGAQIAQLMKQRQVMKMLSPEQTWNK